MEDLPSPLMFGVIAVVLLTFAPKLAQATILEFEYVIEFSQGLAPEGDPDETPWLTATFDDGGTAGSVTLTLEGTNLTGAEFVPEWYFNLDPALYLSSLVIEQLDVLDTVAASDISTGTDAFQADEDGFYDILIQFSKTGAPDGRFMDEDTAIFEITLGGLTAADFNFLAEPDSGPGPFQTAAKVQGIGDADESGWVAPSPSPEPATMLLLGAGLIGMAAFGRKKFFKKA